MLKRKAIVEATAEGLLVLVGALWGSGIPVGLAYWITHGDLLKAVLSVIIPLFGLLSTLADTFL